jgi:hypothetical protein
MQNLLPHFLTFKPSFCAPTALKDLYLCFFEGKSATLDWLEDR